MDNVGTVFSSTGYYSSESNILVINVMNMVIPQLLDIAKQLLTAMLILSTLFRILFDMVQDIIVQNLALVIKLYSLLYIVVWITTMPYAFTGTKYYVFFTSLSLSIM